MFLSFYSGAQSELLTLTPRHGMGYMAWKDTIHGVKFWRASVFKRTFDTTGAYVDTAIERFDIWNKNFFKVPSQYATSSNAMVQYLADLTAHNQSNAVVATVSDIELSDKVTIENGASWSPEHFVACNGPNFAWRIQQYVHPNQGSAIYCLKTHFNYDQENQLSFPFYEYMTPTYFESVKCQSPSTTQLKSVWSTFHNIPALWISEFGWNQTSAYGFPLAATVQNFGGLNDWNGYEITPGAAGAVRSLKKDLGPWAGGYIIETPALPLSSQGLGQLENWLLLFNEYADFPSEVPHPLTCPNSLYQGHYGDDAPCVPTEIGTIWTTGDNPGDLVSPFLMYWDCLEVGESYQQGWPIALDEGNGWNFTVIGHKPTGSEKLFEISSEDILDSLGYFNGINFSVSPGLHTITGTTFGGKEINLVYEFQNAVNFVTNQSHMLDATVFPVPIQGNTYSINMKTDVNLRFSYELFNSQNNRLYHHNFILSANHDDDHFIDPSLSLPTGLLIHKFTFEDGSVKTISTIK